MRYLKLILAFTAGIVATPAVAAPILPGGFTSVTLTAAPVLTSLGITVGTVGTAQVTSAAGATPVVAFPITGGIANADGTLLIQHNGSGLSLTKGSVVVTLNNFLVDTLNAVIGADAFANGVALSASQIPVFSIGSGLGLTLTAGAAAALDSAFSTTAFTASTAIGTAATSPRISGVPEPASFQVLAACALALVVVRRLV